MTSLKLLYAVSVSEQYLYAFGDWCFKVYCTWTSAVHTSIKAYLLSNCVILANKTNQVYANFISIFLLF